MYEASNCSTSRDASVSDRRRNRGRLCRVRIYLSTDGSIVINRYYTKVRNLIFDTTLKGYRFSEYNNVIFILYDSFLDSIVVVRDLNLAENSFFRFCYRALAATPLPHSCYLFSIRFECFVDAHAQSLINIFIRSNPWILFIMFPQNCIFRVIIRLDNRYASRIERIIEKYPARV